MAGLNPPHPTPQQMVNFFVIIPGVNYRADPHLVQVIAGPGVAGAPRMVQYNLDGVRMTVPATGLPVADLVSTASALIGGPSYAARVIVGATTLPGALDILRNQKEHLAKMIHFRNMAPLPRLRYQNVKHEILGFLVLPPAGPGISLARYEDIPPVIPHPAFTVPLASFGELKEWVDVIPPPMTAPAVTPEVKVTISKDQVNRHDGLAPNYRDYYYNGIDTIESFWAKWGADNAGMKNMPSPFTLFNPLVLLDPNWHCYLALIHVAPAGFTHPFTPDVISWSTSYVAALRGFFLEELNSEMATVKGYHRPLNALMETMEAHQANLATFVRSSENPDLGPKRTVGLIKNTLIPIMGRKKGFNYEQKPKAENLTCPPWLHRLKSVDKTTGVNKALEAKRGRQEDSD